MSIATVITRGYGSFGNIAEVILRGYSPNNAGFVAWTPTVGPGATPKRNAKPMLQLNRTVAVELAQLRNSRFKLTKLRNFLPNLFN